MARIWRMPKVEAIMNTSPEWIIHLLDVCSADVRLPIIMTLWRNWHVRNEVYHNKPAPPVEASCRFLCGYINSLVAIQQHPHADDLKGKTVVAYRGQEGSHKSPVVRPSKSPERWNKPPPGWVKLNVDGSWRQEDETGGAGMILRDHIGSIIFASCRFIQRCTSALEAEIAAILEGVSLARDRSNEHIMVEMDCMVAARMITAQVPDRSLLAPMVNDIKHLLSSRSHGIMAIGRDQNKASHALAHMGCVLPKTAVWLRCAPNEILALCQSECNDSG